MRETLNLILVTLTLSILLLSGCKEKNQEENPKPSKIIDQVTERGPILPTESIGIFTGEEPAYSMKVGNQMIPMPASKWRIEISPNFLNIQQVSDGQTIHYTGEYKIKSMDKLTIVIESRLIDDKYNQAFTPILRFYKTTNIWFLEGVAGSEGCSSKQL